MPTMVLMLSALLAGSRPVRPSLGGVTVPRWTPCLSWATNAAATYAVTEQNGNLVFTTEAAGVFRSRFTAAEETA